MVLRNETLEYTGKSCYYVQKHSRNLMNTHEGESAMNWNDLENNTIQEYIDFASFDVADEYICDTLDVNETISELAYLTHDYFRYYGKFPSKVAKYIIATAREKGVISSQEDFIFDNYNGSGTSLVEAKIAGFESGGIDINPFGVLASNVKTHNLNEQALHEKYEGLIAKIKSSCRSGEQQTLFYANNISAEDERGIAEINKQMYIDFPDIDKWFNTDVIYELSAIKYFLLKMKLDCYRQFFSLGFFSIIRRVSKAHDAEVRPHVNHKKRKRNAVEAYEKKLKEMISTMKSWNKVTSKEIEAQTFLCDNSNTARVTDVINKLAQKYHKRLGLVISHPPYLNSFDYIPVYRLKFLWAFGFDEIYGNLSYQEIKSEEVRSYPASSNMFVNNYFRHNINAYKIIYDSLKPGGYCCVVIGDCTIKKELFSVHKMLIKAIEDIGFTVDKVTYRSTAYGMGRYAYKHRADYNDKDGGKKDAIIFFKK